MTDDDARNPDRSTPTGGDTPGRPGEEDDSESLFDFLRSLDTEQRNPRSMRIDLAEAGEIARLINEEDQKVAPAVKKRLPEIARAIEAVRAALASGGRLIYAGAGTSGRLGVLDAAECPPTFGTDPDRVQGLIAGGREAMFVAQEGAEDFEENGRKAMEDIGLNSYDILIGLAASGRTPYVHGALREAAERGCLTVMVTTVPGEQVRLEVDIMIDVPVGPEVIMGSTRMKSATAQKMVLNMISTGAMVRLGKIYENVMVDLQLTNRKLHERARRILMLFSNLDYEGADRAMKASGGNVKVALVMTLGEVERPEAERLLARNDGFVRRTLHELGVDSS
ncbi:MAG: N-acetylmuramic acid 6-phosphate etherase [Balneolaceae bacterium]|nr:N-acetylmuramic acid 6-phosphate etherase [Balneolaceae bacterium]